MPDIPDVGSMPIGTGRERSQSCARNHKTSLGGPPRCQGPEPVGQPHVVDRSIMTDPSEAIHVIGQAISTCQRVGPR